MNPTPTISALQSDHDGYLFFAFFSLPQRRPQSNLMSAVFARTARPCNGRSMGQLGQLGSRSTGRASSSTVWGAIAAVPQRFFNIGPDPAKFFPSLRTLEAGRSEPHIISPSVHPNRRITVVHGPTLSSFGPRAPPTKSLLAGA